MSLIIIRADSNEKILNAIADLERHGGLKVIGKTRLMRRELADRLASSNLRGPLGAGPLPLQLWRLREDDTESIMAVRRIHPRRI